MRLYDWLMLETDDWSDPLLIAMRAFERVLLALRARLECVNAPANCLQLLD